MPPEGRRKFLGRKFLGLVKKLKQKHWMCINNYKPNTNGKRVSSSKTDMTIHRVFMSKPGIPYVVAASSEAEGDERERTRFQPPISCNTLTTIRLGSNQCKQK